MWKFGYATDITRPTVKEILSCNVLCLSVCLSVCLSDTCMGIQELEVCKKLTFGAQLIRVTCNARCGCEVSRLKKKITRPYVARACSVTGYRSRSRPPRFIELRCEMRHNWWMIDWLTVEMLSLQNTARRDLTHLKSQRSRSRSSCITKFRPVFMPSTEGVIVKL